MNKQYRALESRRGGVSMTRDVGDDLESLFRVCDKITAKRPKFGGRMTQQGAEGSQDGLAAIEFW